MQAGSSLLQIGDGEFTIVPQVGRQGPAVACGLAGALLVSITLLEWEQNLIGGNSYVRRLTAERVRVTSGSLGLRKVDAIVRGGGGAARANRLGLSFLLAPRPNST